MSEPPLHITPEGPEAHPRKIGHRFLDMVIAGAAILISVISLIVAVSHGRTMEKLVAANSWPLLRYETSNLDDETRLPVIDLTIENAGVGPAIVKSFTVLLDGKPVRDQGELLSTCCGEPPEPRPAGQRLPGQRNVAPITSSVEETVVRAGERRTYLRLAHAPEIGPQWEALNKARFRVTFDACYCSVLGDCWRSNLTGVDARPVKQCPAPMTDRTAAAPRSSIPDARLMR